MTITLSKDGNSSSLGKGENSAMINILNFEDFEGEKKVSKILEFSRNSPIAQLREEVGERQTREGAEKSSSGT